MKPYCGEGAPITETVVFLLDRLVGCGYRLFMDNFYNSVAMCSELLNMKTHVCGTLRKHRGAPPDIRQASDSNLGMGETIMRHNDDVMVLAWRDKRIVNMVSTFHQHEMEDVMVWQKNVRARVPKPKPVCILEY